MLAALALRTPPALALEEGEMRINDRCHVSLANIAENPEAYEFSIKCLDTYDIYYMRCTPNEFLPDSYGCRPLTPAVAAIPDPGDRAKAADSGPALQVVNMPDPDGLFSILCAKKCKPAW